MPSQSPLTLPARRGSIYRYADRVKAVQASAEQFDVLIDGLLRFRIEGDGQWPAQWRLFSVTDEVRAAEPIAIESEYWDVIAQLERGEHWMPSEVVEHASAQAARCASYMRWPEYLPER